MIRRKASEEQTYVPTSPETGSPLRLYDEGYAGFPQYSTDFTREQSLLEMVPILKNKILESILHGEEDWQNAFDSVLSEEGAGPGEFEEVRRRVFIALPTEIQEEVDY